MNSSILVIDDDAEDIEIIQDAFNSLQYSNVSYYSNATEAMEHLSSVTPELLPKLIVTDNCIPATPGFELIRRVKQEPKFSSIEVVVLSTFVSKSNREKLLEAGVSQVIHKPQTFPAYLSLSLSLAKLADQQSERL